MSLSVAIRKRLKGFTLDVAFESGGRPLGMLGASGSGKSMTLRCIAGIETPDEGRITCNGRVLFDSAKRVNLAPQKRKIGYLFQNYALFPNMTIAQNIACAIVGEASAKQKAIDGLIERFSLTGLEARYPSQLSGGQQQRVALARIWAYQPEALLLDEPFSALDAHLKEALQIEMKDLLDGYQGDVVMVTHSRDEVFRLCPALLTIDEGRVASFGETRGLFAQPGKLVTARLTGCKNLSRAMPISHDLVRALDWDVDLSVVPPVPEGMTHVGIRAHDFTPCDRDAVNAIPVRALEWIESPFERDLIFRNDRGRDDADTIWWKAARGENPESAPPHLGVSPDKVLLLC